MDEIGAEKPVSSMTVESGLSYFARLAAEGFGAEPIFILRGRDILAPHIVMAWALSAEKSGIGLKKIAGAWEAAEKMIVWPGRRMPD